MPTIHDRAGGVNHLGHNVMTFLMRNWYRLWVELDAAVVNFWVFHYSTTVSCFNVYRVEKTCGLLFFFSFEYDFIDNSLSLERVSHDFSLSK